MNLLDDNQIEKQLRKRNIYYRMLWMWFWAESHGKSVSKYLADSGYKKVAIYGMAEIGELLYYELLKVGIEIPFVIDQNRSILCECPVISPHSNIPKADLIIITAEYYVEEITELLKKTDIPLMSIQQAICFATGFSM